MRESLNLSTEERINYFDFLRKNYRIRRELNNLEAVFRKKNSEFKNLLKVLRVKIN